MLSFEDNELLTDVSPGTSMHATIKRFWLPVAAADVIARRDSDPIRITVLGMNYVLFRDSEGKIGLLNERCAHRGASLALGRVEEGGIRCLYHGWKYGTEGQILETPNAKKGQYNPRFRQPCYPVREAGGLIWAYFGPAELEPPFPKWDVLGLPKENIVVQEAFLDTNFAQIVEGFLDSTHLPFLHRDSLTSRLPASGTNDFDALTQQYIEDQAGITEIEDTDFGFHYVTVRETKSGAVVRVTDFSLPIFTFNSNQSFSASVPIDSKRTLLLKVDWDPEVPFDDDRRALLWNGHGLSPANLDRLGLSRKTYKASGAEAQLQNFAQDRAQMRSGRSYSGLPNFVPEDLAIGLSMGAISDRTTEHLLPCDRAAVRMRKTLLDAARAVQEGGDPKGLRPTQLPRSDLFGEVSDASQWRAVLTQPKKNPPRLWEVQPVASGA